jgi:hypothetical protein
MKTALGSMLAWDCLLPLVALAAPHLVLFIWPRDMGAQLLTILFMPMMIAFARTRIGSNQLRDLHDGRLPAGRQVALALAIVLLMCFEGSTTMLVFADDEPADAWLWPAGFYAAYLPAAALAFYCANEETSRGSEERFEP